MFKYVIFCAAVGLTLAAPQYRPQHVSSGDEAHAEVKTLQSDVRADGFNYALETSNGIHAVSAGDAAGNVHGDFEWVSPEGEHIKVVYVADENGYQPQSSALPTPPPIPDAILRSLEYIRTHPPKDDSAYHHQPSAVANNYHQSSFNRKQDRLNAVRFFYEQFNYAPFLIYAGSQPYLIISDPNNMESILSSTTLTYKYDLYNFLYPWLGKGLLTSNGQHWLKHRKMITPSFHFTILQDFLHIINETTDRFMVLLDGFAKTQEIFDFQEIVARCTVDVICESAMGTRVNAIEGPTSPIVAALNDVCFVIQERIFSVFKRFQPIYVFSKEYRTQERALRVLRKELSQIIEKRQELLKSMDNSKKYADDDMRRPKMAFLDNLLTAEIDGRSLTFQEIFEEVSTFMFEGHDTTSTAISFITFCLSRHPEAQAKAFDEQLRMFGPDLTRTPTYQELQDMKYLEMVIKEALRLFPSVPFIGRTLKERTVVAGYTVPEGTTLLLNIFGVGTNAANYPEPFKFKPERFEADSREKAHPFGYVPFSAGPRNCIGQKFAMMELKVTVSKMLRHFQILPAVDGLSAGIPDKAGPNVKPNNPYDPQLGVLITLKSVNGIKIRLQKRIY